MTKAAQEAFAQVFESSWLQTKLAHSEKDTFVEVSTIALRAFLLGRAFGHSEHRSE
jgi:hypothetical protein